MAIEQSFILTNTVGASFQSLDDIRIGLTGGGTNTSFNLIDDEITLTSLSLNVYNINFSTSEGSLDTECTLTLFFTLENDENCEKSVAFTPAVFDCLPSAIEGFAGLQYTTFVVDGLDQDGKVVFNSLEDCLTFVKT